MCVFTLRPGRWACLRVPGQALGVASGSWASYAAARREIPGLSLPCCCMSHNFLGRKPGAWRETVSIPAGRRARVEEGGGREREGRELKGAGRGCPAWKGVVPGLPRPSHSLKLPETFKFSHSILVPAGLTLLPFRGASASNSLGGCGTVMSGLSEAQLGPCSSFRS